LYHYILFFFLTFIRLFVICKKMEYTPLISDSFLHMLQVPSSTVSTITFFEINYILKMMLSFIY